MIELSDILAEVAHAVWCEMIRDIMLNGITAERVKRWGRLMDTPWERLTDIEKASDYYVASSVMQPILYNKIVKGVFREGLTGEGSAPRFSGSDYTVAGGRKHSPVETVEEDVQSEDAEGTPEIDVPVPDTGDVQAGDGEDKG